MEEFVANELEAKHRFLLDVLIQMAMLEEELETLDDRLEEPEEVEPEAADGKKDDEQKQEGAGEEAKEEGGTVAKDEEGAEGAVKEEDGDADGSTIRALMEQQEKEEQKLMEELQKQKEQRAKALVMKMKLKKKILAAGDVAAVSSDSDENSDVLFMPVDVVEQELEKVSKDKQELEAQHLQAAKAFYLAQEEKSGEKGEMPSDVDLLEMYARQEREAQRLHDELLQQKNKRAAALQDRLAKLRAARGSVCMDLTDAAGVGEHVAATLGLEKEGDGRVSVTVSSADPEAAAAESKHGEEKVADEFIGEKARDGSIDIRKDDAAIPEQLLEQQATEKEAEVEDTPESLLVEEAVQEELTKLDQEIAATVEHHR